MSIHLVICRKAYQALVFQEVKRSEQDCIHHTLDKVFHYRQRRKTKYGRKLQEYPRLTAYLKTFNGVDEKEKI